MINEWISVLDKLPDDTRDVLCFDANNRQFVGNYTKGHEIEYADDDYDGEYDEVEDRNGTLYLKCGWYECEEQIRNNYDTFWIKRNVTHWKELDERPRTDKATEILRIKADSKNVNPRNFLISEGYVIGAIEEREKVLEELRIWIVDYWYSMDTNLYSDDRDNIVKFIESLKLK